MNQRTEDQLKELKETRERIDEYEGTIHALWSFVSITTWDKNNERQKEPSSYSLGRQMSLTDLDITPDAVIQVGQDIGYVVEAKYSMPRNKDYWQDDVLQLIKYDNPLCGWWTESQEIGFHNVVLLIEYGRSVLFKDYIQQWVEKAGYTFKNNFAVVEFSRADNASHYYAFRKISGDIQDESISTALYASVKVPRDAVISSYPVGKFYDTAPPVTEYTMVTMWIHVFPQIRDSIEYNKKLKAYPIHIKLDELTLEIQKLYGQVSGDKRSVAFPQSDWIKDALDEFEKMDLAKKLNREIDGYDYLVLHKDLHVDDVLEYFVANRNKRKSKKGKQLRLI